MLRLYGKGGRTFRSIWMLEEAGVAYERIPIDWSAGESHTDRFLAINPNGKVPVLQDDDEFYFESFAINYHVARKHANHLWVPENFTSEAIQWLAWGMGELEGPHDAANRASAEIDHSRLDRSLNALRVKLSEQAYMMGDSFTVVDLNTACLLLRPQYRPVIEGDGGLLDWFQRCISRPALNSRVN